VFYPSATFRIGHPDQSGMIMRFSSNGGAWNAGRLSRSG
jgi:hypothetical protein